MPTSYCIFSLCMNTSEWKDVLSIVGVVLGVPGLIFAAVKTLREVRRLTEQRAAETEQRSREHQLKRAEFTLAKHRRLFDDPVLYSVLQVLDGDQDGLRPIEMSNPKRKFLTFFEELVLLIDSGFISKDVALYMFGYYAVWAHRGKYFQHGIAYAVENWGLFMRFAEEAEAYLDSPVARTVTELHLQGSTLATSSAGPACWHSGLITGCPTLEGRLSTKRT